MCRVRWSVAIEEFLRFLKTPEKGIFEGSARLPLLQNLVKKGSKQLAKTSGSPNLHQNVFGEEKKRIKMDSVTLQFRGANGGPWLPWCSFHVFRWGQRRSHVLSCGNGPRRAPTSPQKTQNV